MTRIVRLLAVAALVGGFSAAAAAGAAADPPEPEPSTAWFGPALDWQQDSAEAYDRRLGADASLFGRSVGYPLSPTSELLFRDLSRQSAAAQAVAVLTMEPADLVGLTPDDADDFAALVATATEEDGSFLLLRFAPEMNGSWTAWGRRPVTYIRAFRALADAVHDATEAAAMVWAPAYGAGYPDAAGGNATTTPGPEAPQLDKRNVPFLDTDGDGEVTEADDPYGPYYPGDDYVDWVGLTMLRYGVKPSTGANSLPKAGELDGRFKERFGYDERTKGASFYARFSGVKQKPFLLTTAAMYDPSSGGSSEEAVKHAWLRQVVAAVEARAGIQAVQWLEQTRVEPEVGGTVRWEIADDVGLASISRAVLEQGAVTFGPLDDVGGGVGSPVQVSPRGLDDDRLTAVAPSSEESGGGLPAFLGGALAALGVVLVLGLVVLQLRRRRLVPPWLR